MHSVLGGFQVEALQRPLDLPALSREYGRIICRDCIPLLPIYHRHVECVEMTVLLHILSKARRSCGAPYDKLFALLWLQDIRQNLKQNARAAPDFCIQLRSLCKAYIYAV